MGDILYVPLLGIFVPLFVVVQELVSPYIMWLILIFTHVLTNRYPVCLALDRAYISRENLTHG